MKRLMQLQSITRRNRHEVHRQIVDTVLSLGGWVDDIRHYSNLMLTVQMTLPRGAYGALAASLGAIGVPLDLPPDLTASHRGNDEQSASLQVNFVHNEPDLKRPVPAVPG